MEGAKRQFAKISNMGLNPIIVIARADEIDTSIRTAPMAKCAEIEAQRESAAQCFGIPLSRVHISVPYCAEEERVFDIERQAYKLLDAVLQAAVEFKSLSTVINQCGGGLDWGVPDDYPQLQPQPVAQPAFTPMSTPITPVALPVREGVSMCASTSDDSSDGSGNDPEAGTQAKVKESKAHLDQILLSAAWNGNAAEAIAAIEAGAGLEARTSNGNNFTPLMHAAGGGHPDIVQLLLDNGAQLGALDPWGNDALHHCTDYAHKKGSSADSARCAQLLRAAAAAGSSDAALSADSAMATQMQQMMLQQRKLEAKMMEMQQQHKREPAATAQLAALGGQGDPACAALLQSMFAFGS
jgi:hypothetical protein